MAAEAGAARAAAVGEEEESFFWFWYGDDGEWKAFDRTIMDRLEGARLSVAAMPATTMTTDGDEQPGVVRLKLNPDSPIVYDLNVKTCEQTNIFTGHVRPISKVTACWYYRSAVSYTHLTLPTNREV